jgi:adenylosuccinate synthase
MQGIADARIAPRFVTRTYMVARTYPIRVGNHNGNSSGGCYPDQQEIEWNDIGQEPELTTVTQRVRRIFTFSRTQFEEAVAANQPDFVLMNFMNYLRPDEVKEMTDYLRRFPFYTMYGHGPEDNDVIPF